MKNLLTITLFLLLGYNAHAQFNLKDKFLKSMEPEKKDSVQIHSNPDGSSTIKTKDAEVKIEESTQADIRPNTFIGSFTMNFENTTKGKKSTGKVEYYFKEWYSLMIPQLENSKETNMRNLFDHKKLTTTMLTIDKKGEKTGIVTKTPKITVNPTSEGQKSFEGKLEKTNDKKTIEGYTCYKWIYTSDEGVNECWITTDIKYNLGNAIALFNISSKNNKSGDNGFNKMEGFCLEATNTLKNGDVTHFTITQIKLGEPSDNLFSTEGYEIMDMSSFGNMFGR